MAKRGDARPRTPPGDASDPQGMPALLRDFLDWLQVRNYSPATIHNRLDQLCFFLAWAADRGLTRPAEVTKPVLERYQRWLAHHRKANGDPLGVPSQINYLVAIKAWFKWLARHNHTAYNPAGELDLPKKPLSLPKNVLTAAEAELVLARPDTGTPLGVRDRAILEVLYSTGLRRMEVANLAAGDVDRTRGTVFVRKGKGQKDRVVPVSDRAAGWVERYAAEARPRLAAGGRASHTLFLTNMGDPFTPDRLSGLVVGYIAGAELGKGGGCHTFRHTLATLMLEGGADIRHVQLMLGHASVATTQIYTQVSIRVLKEVHARTHPGNQPRPADDPS